MELNLFLNSLPTQSIPGFHSLISQVVFNEEIPSQLPLKLSLPLQSGEQLSNIKEHTKQINDIQTSRDMTMFITASKDNTAKVSFSSSLGGISWQDLCSEGFLLLGNVQ